MFSLSRLRTWTAAAVIANAVGASPVVAQSQPPPDAPGTNLSLSASVFGGYDTDITGATLGAGIQPSAALGGAIFTVNYRTRTEKIGFSTRASADSRYYNAEEPLGVSAFSGSALFGLQATSRVKLDASARSMFSPQFAFSPWPLTDTPDDLPPPVLDHGISTYDVLTTSGSVAARIQVTKRSAVNLTYGAAQYRYIEDGFEMNSSNFGGGYSYNVTRYATLRLGYYELEANYPAFVGSPADVIRQRSFDAGLDYSRPLSLSRRTTLSFGSGSSAINNNDETFYTLTANANLRHQFSRTWDVNVGYTRGLGVLAGFTEPFFADSVNVALDGSLTRRLTLTASSGFSNGAVGLGSRGQDFKSFQSRSRLEWELHEQFGVFGGYSYYQYAFQQGAGIPGVPSDLGRHSVRVGMAFWFPIMEERIPRVTR